MKFLHREANLFFIALTLLTRLPAPRWVIFDAENMQCSTRYYSLVGMVIGAIAALAYMLFALFFTAPLAIVLSMAVSIVLTGGFHEDGFADSCDGFGGGQKKSQILAVMKDSRVGTFAVLGLWLLLTTKFFALLSFVSYPGQSLGFVLVLAHSISRLVAVSLLYNYDYVQDYALSKLKLLTNNMNASALLFSVVLVLPLLAGLSVMQAIALTLMLLVFRFLAGHYLEKKIGGYTGDCLGAVQQLSEVLIYLLLLVVAK